MYTLHMLFCCILSAILEIRLFFKFMKLGVKMTFNKWSSLGLSVSKVNDFSTPYNQLGVLLKLQLFGKSLAVYIKNLNHLGSFLDSIIPILGICFKVGISPKYRRLYVWRRSLQHYLDECKIESDVNVH